MHSDSLAVPLGSKSMTLSARGCSICMTMNSKFNALLQRIADDLGTTLRGVDRSSPQSIKVQLENFQIWQIGKGVEYYRWPSEAMEALHARLMKLGPGCELIPCFAMSVQVKLPNGKLI